jgi:hypothetical protein
MSKTGAILVCAAGLLLGTVSGCTLDMTSLNIFAASNERAWEFDGSLETVSTTAQNTLRDLGVTVSVSKQGEAVHVSSCTDGTHGKRFTLVLNRVKGPNGDKTRVQIEWGEDGVDNDFWSKLIGQVGTNMVNRREAPIHEKAWSDHAMPPVEESMPLLRRE